MLSVARWGIRLNFVKSGDGGNHGGGSNGNGGGGTTSHKGKPLLYAKSDDDEDHDDGDGDESFEEINHVLSLTTSPRTSSHSRNSTYPCTSNKNAKGSSYKGNFYDDDDIL